MRKIILNNSDYIFDASANTVRVTNTNLQKYFNHLDLLLITNTTRNEIIYNFGVDNFGGAFSGSTLTLETSTSAYDDSDTLQIILYDREDAEKEAIIKTHSLTEEHLDALQNILAEQKLTNEFLKQIAE